MGKSDWVVLTDGVGGRTIGRAKIVSDGLGAVKIEAVVNDADMCTRLNADVSYLSITPSANAKEAGITSVARVTMDYGTLGVHAMAEAIEEGDRASRLSRIYDPNRATQHTTRFIAGGGGA